VTSVEPKSVEEKLPPTDAGVVEKSDVKIEVAVSHPLKTEIEESPKVVENAGQKIDTEVELAEMLIRNDKYGPAKRRLKALIEKYPDDPKIEKVKKRLDQIKNRD
jgi:hypothetical protein